MKRNFTVKLTTLNGDVLVQKVPHPDNVTEKDAKGKEIKGEDGKPVIQTILQELVASDLICTALLSPFNDEQPNAEEKHKRYKLAQRINEKQKAVKGESDVEISSEEATLIKTLCSKLYAPLIVGQLIDLIES